MNDNFFSQSACRLKSERIRLGLNQAEAGGLCGVSREMWGKYERGLAVPGGEVLFSFAAAGADVQYIFTDIRGVSLATDHTSEAVAQVVEEDAEESERMVEEALTPREAALLDNYRHVENDTDKRVIERTAFLAAKAEEQDEETTERKTA